MTAQSPSLSHQEPERDFPYFRRLWNTIVVALSAAAFIPLLVIGGGMYLFAASALKEQTLSSLGQQVEHHQKSVDRFLIERIRDLKQAVATTDMANLARPETLAGILGSLNEEGVCFTDLGIIDEKGRHLAYVGPYDLMDKKYVDQKWFKAVMATRVHVSDVFSGFRKVPHFIIAVRRDVDGRAYVIRATVEAAYFDALVGSATASGSGSSFLVNSQGNYQTTPPGPGKLMGPSDIVNPQRFKGIRIEEQRGHIRVMGWLKAVDWLSVVEMDRSDIFAKLSRVRMIGIIVLVLGAVLIGITVVMTTSHLVQRLETKRRSINLMDHHLRRANKMTLSVQLYNGFFQEINETLVNIDTAVTWIDEQVNKANVLPQSREDIGEGVTQIHEQILRSRKTIHDLIRFSQPADPLIVDIDINRLLDELTELFRRELHYKGISLEKDFEAHPPLIPSDPSRLRQVFQNLIFNALDAVGQNGHIGLKTGSSGRRIRVTVSDNGPGISKEIIGRVFDPLFTTHPKRLGLGLSISRSIVEKLGGTIRIDADPGKGTVVVVELPIQFPAAH